MNYLFKIYLYYCSSQFYNLEYIHICVMMIKCFVVRVSRLLSLSNEDVYSMSLITGSDISLFLGIYA